MSAPLLIFALLLALLPHSSDAQEIADPQDTELWLQINSQVPVSETWSLLVEGQPRWNQNVSHYDRVVLRVGALRHLTPTIQVSAAYAFVPRRTAVGTVYEHQSYQQAVFLLPRLGRWAVQARIREDQRHLAQWADAAHRIRGQVRVTRPLPGGRAWRAVIYDEVFVNWDTTARGPTRGLEQNRLFAGVNRQLTRDLAVETGYLWQDQFRKNDRLARHNHIALVQFQFRPRGLRGRALTPVPVPLPVTGGSSAGE